jgi:hypothetical protein
MTRYPASRSTRRTISQAGAASRASAVIHEHDQRQDDRIER